MIQDDRTAVGLEPAEHDDLSRVLPCVTSWYAGTRKTQTARDKLANHPLTREYLDAGLRLMGEQFRPGEAGRNGAGADGGAPGGSDADSPGRPAYPDNAVQNKQSAFFDWLSAQKIIDEVDRSGEMRGNQGTFEDRWPYKDYYIQDLLSYSLWARHWAREAQVAQESAAPLATSEDFVQAVHEAAYWSCQAQLANTSSRVWLIASAVSDRYPAMKTAMRKIHDRMNASWMPVYDAVVAGRGLRLRPGVTIEDLTEILSALTTGVSLHIAADSDPGLIDHARRRSLLGTAAIAVLASCIDPGDGQSLEQAITDLVTPQQPAA
jgi:hypothetical protein